MEFTASEALLAEITALRQTFHRYPELSDKEQQTTERLRSFLAAHGIDCLPTSLKTGLAAELGSNGPLVALRCDIDALPVDEETLLSYQSKNKGVMHACGHDLHMASLAGAAVMLKEKEAELSGRIRLIFQPAEETHNGAEEVLQAGLLQDVRGIIGYHNKPDLPLGTIGIKEGPLMAAVDEFKVTIIGTGTHAGEPQDGNDPIVTASQIITALQSIVSRHISPLDAVVVSVTQIIGGRTWNVIPESVFFEGTIRTFSRHDQQESRTLLEQIVKHYASAVGQTSEIAWTPSQSEVNNAHSLTEIIRPAVKEFAEVVVPKQTLGGDDFCYYQEKIPGFYAFIGTGCPYEWHNPKFLVDDAALPYAMRYFAASATAVLDALAAGVELV